MNDIKHAVLDIIMIIFGKDVSSITRGLTKMADKLEAHADKQATLSKRNMERATILANASVAAADEGIRATATAANIKKLIAQ